MRDITHIFLEKTEQVNSIFIDASGRRADARQLKEVWQGLVTTTESSTATVEVMHYLTKTTLDVIGLAGTTNLPSFELSFIDSIIDRF